MGTDGLLEGVAWGLVAVATEGCEPRSTKGVQEQDKDETALIVAS